MNNGTIENVGIPKRVDQPPLFPHTKKKTTHTQMDHDGPISLTRVLSSTG